MAELPDNVTVSKRNRPKNWSYPVQTTELLDGLDLGSVGCPVSIFYDNTLSNFNQTILTVTWMGGQDEPYFHIGVRAVPRMERPLWNQVITTEGPLRVLKKWMQGSRAPRRIERAVLWQKRPEGTGTVHIRLELSGDLLGWETWKKIEEEPHDGE